MNRAPVLNDALTVAGQGRVVNDRYGHAGFPCLPDMIRGAEENNRYLSIQARRDRG
ncbi:MAG: hypothetical protein AAGU11_11340 [Syntrophobacteraceae bacterium]